MRTLLPPPVRSPARPRPFSAARRGWNGLRTAVLLGGLGGLLVLWARSSARPGRPSACCPVSARSAGPTGTPTLVSPLTGADGRTALFGTHPPVEQRIARLIAAV